MNTGGLRNPPIIEGEAQDLTERPAKSAKQASSAARPDAELTPAGAAPPKTNAPVAPARRRSFVMLLGSSAIGAVLVAAGVYGWSVMTDKGEDGEAARPPTVASAEPDAKPAPKDAAGVKTAPSPNASIASSAKPEPAVPPEPKQAAVLAAPAPESTPRSAQNQTASPLPGTDAGPAPALAKKDAPLPAAPGYGVAAAPDQATAPAAAEDFAALKAQLAKAQADLGALTERLQKIEAQLAPEKAETRAPVSPRESAVAAVSSDAPTRAIVAQSLVGALRDGTTFQTEIDALARLDADPEQIAILRANVDAPDARKLATDFRALKSRVVAAASAPAVPANASQAPVAENGTVDSLLARFEAAAKRLVRVRRLDATGDGEDAAAVADRVEAALVRGDIASALTERGKLPAAAQAVSENFAKAAQARLNAQAAAQTILKQALTGLGKAKS